MFPVLRLHREQGPNLVRDFRIGVVRRSSRSASLCRIPARLCTCMRPGTWCRRQFFPCPCGLRYKVSSGAFPGLPPRITVHSSCRDGCRFCDRIPGRIFCVAGLCSLRVSRCFCGACLSRLECRTCALRFPGPCAVATLHVCARWCAEHRFSVKAR